MAAGKDDHMTLMNIHKIQNTTRILRVPASRRKLLYTCCLLLLCARAVGSVLMQQGNTNILKSEYDPETAGLSGLYGPNKEGMEGLIGH